MPVRSDVGTSPAAGLAREPGFGVREPDIIGLWSSNDRRLGRPRGVRARVDHGQDIRGARAVARGVKMGRGYALNPEQRRQALARLDAVEASREIARIFNVAHTTIGKLATGPLNAFCIDPPLALFAGRLLALLDARETRCLFLPCVLFF